VWQGEILETLVQIKLNLENIEGGEEGTIEVNPVTHDLVVVMSQDCDLEQDYVRRQGAAAGTLPNVLFCDVYRAEILRAKLHGEVQLSRQDWKKRIAQNQNERFHYLQRVEPNEDLRGQGLPALAIDFKIYFSLPTDELYARLGQGAVQGALRRCRLNTPYTEHLAHRFYKFQSRVALPQDHEVDQIPE